MSRTFVMAACGRCLNEPWSLLLDFRVANVVIIIPAVVLVIWYSPNMRIHRPTMPCLLYLHALHLLNTPSD